MANEQTLGVGVIGLGFMGQTHLRAYRRAEHESLPCRVVAVCDCDTERFTGKPAATGNIASASGGAAFDPDHTAKYSEPDALLADDRVHLVSVCTHTDTHVDIAVRALLAGKHVIVEKPVALAVEPIELLRRTADQAARVCMPAMCMRLWPGWTWLRDAVAERRFGRILAARFERLGAAPAWSQDFYADSNRSGGALFDLHVHDVDFIYHLLGRAARVRSFGTADHVTTAFDFDDVTGQVIAEGGWLTAPAFPFRMRFLVEFERAVADFDLAREPALIVHRDAGPETPNLPMLSGYDAEIRHVIDLALGKRIAPLATLDDAIAVTQTILAEQESLRTGAPVCIAPR